MGKAIAGIRIVEAAMSAFGPAAGAAPLREDEDAIIDLKVPGALS